MKGIKGFDKDLRCRGMQFEVGKEYKTGYEEVRCCSRTGIHFCETIQQVHEYYSCNNDDNRYCEVEVLGVIAKEDDKCATNHIRIVREITGKELDVLLGKVNGNTGLFNTGNKNTGNWNTGNKNTGYMNTGNKNTGYMNTGNKNTGNWNTGDKNTGNKNTGYMNTGDWNKCNRSTGLFNTEERTITIFNVDSGLTYREARDTDWYGALQSSSFVLTEWIEYTEEEKKNSIIRQYIGGYLKKYTYEEACANWWAKMTDKNKELIQTMPNFNKDIFEEITGIDLKKED